LLTDSTGAVLVEARIAEPGTAVEFVTALRGAWSFLCRVPEKPGVGNAMVVVMLCKGDTLEALMSVEIGCVQVSHMLSVGGNSGGAVHPAWGSILLVCEEPRVLLSVSCINEHQALAGFHEGSRNVLPLSAALPKNGIDASVCSAALLVGSECLVVLGLSDGSVCLLRSIETHFCAGSLQLCGRHFIAPEEESPVVACGFAADVKADEDHRPPLFAATCAGRRRLWITGGVCRGATASPAEQQALSASRTTALLDCPPVHRATSEPLGKTDLGPADVPRDPPRAAACPPKVLNSDAEDHGGGGDSAARQPMMGPEDGPLPRWSELEALIDQTAREIAELEGQEALSAMRDDGDLQAATPVPQLPPFSEPRSPRIARVARASCLNQKWARAQRELIDPAELTRSFLDRSVMPQPKPPEPWWVPEDCPEVSMDRDRWECSIESLSFDPLAYHVRSLCRP